jgi:hypothetical protein
MSTPLSICYVTGRKEPLAPWFFSSLHRELNGDYTGIQIVIVDFYAEGQREGEEWSADEAAARCAEYRSICPAPDLVVSPPCGNVWQGPHRLTTDNFFAKSNSLNTAVMLAKHDWMMVADDLSWLAPGFMECVRQAQHENILLCASYEKRRKMRVDAEGKLVSSEEFPSGKDHRRAVSPARMVGSYSSWFYGCSVCVPVSAILAINGWPTVCDSMGYEDSLTGRVLENNGFRFVFDPRAMSIESEEHHHLGKQMKRLDPGVSPKDKSHKLLELFSGAKRFENYYGEEGLAGLRARVQRGEPLPIIRNPQHEWFTGQPLSEFGRDLRPIDTRT